MNEKIITETIKRIKRRDMSFKIKDYLKSEQLSEDEIALYLEVAKQRIKDHKLERLPKIRKFIFRLLISVAIITFMAYLFILPQFGFRQTTLLSIVGAILLTTSLLYAWVFNKTWTEEHIKLELEQDKKKGNDHSIILVLIPIPAVILFFLFSSVLEWGENNRLKLTQVKAEGTIIESSSNSFGTRRGDINYSNLTVEFFTEEGEKIQATEEISEYEYKQFYRGQKVNLIYSSEDPQNIDLLTHRSDIIKFTDSEEREFKATDLIKLIDLSNREQILSALNKVSFGWKFNSTQNKWENQSKQMVFTKNGNQISLLMGFLAMHRFPGQFMELGYNDITEKPLKNSMIQKERILENENYMVIVERELIIDGAPYYLTTLGKK